MIADAKVNQVTASAYSAPLFVWLAGVHEPRRLMPRHIWHSVRSTAPIIPHLTACSKFARAGARLLERRTIVDAP
jgi:hypothetical protein